MDELKEIRADIKELDGRVTTSEQNIAVLQEKEVNMKDLIQRNVDAYDRLNVTMQNVNQNLTENTISIKQLGIEVADVKEQTMSNKNEIDNLKDERNINIISWLRDNWVSIVLGGGLIFELVKNYI